MPESHLILTITLSCVEWKVFLYGFNLRVLCLPVFFLSFSLTKYFEVETFGLCKRINFRQYRHSSP